MSLENLYDFYNGNIAAMAREIGVSRQYVHQLLKKMGIKGTGSRLNKAQTSLIKEGKLNRTKLSTELGVSPGTITKYTKNHNLPHANLRHTDYEVVEALNIHKWNKAKTAAFLGYHYNAFIRMLKNRGIRKP